jgi:hypothetical protein
LLWLGHEYCCNFALSHHLPPPSSLALECCFALSNFLLKSPIVSNSVNHDFHDLPMSLSRLFPYFNLNKEVQSQVVFQKRNKDSKAFAISFYK